MIDNPSCDRYTSFFKHTDHFIRVISSVGRAADS